MQNEYQITDFSSAGFPFVEVHGDSFCYEDLYELAGKHQFMTTFIMKPGSPSHSKFGGMLTGVIFYNHKEMKAFAGPDTVANTNHKKVRVNCFVNENLQPETVEDLKYGGFDISDIESISFLPLKKRGEFHETGEKRVPNIIEIELGPDDLAGIDVDNLQQSLLIRKNNDGVSLTDFEKEELIGITLAFNNGRIDSRILQHLGFNKETMTANMNIWNSYYNVKERRGSLSEEERQKHTEIKDIIRIERLTKLLQEIAKSGAKGEELGKNKDVLEEITNSVFSFRPSVLLLGKAQVYWDVDSYIHIAMRHFKEYQLGSFKGKTPFSYKVEDLKSLIEKVLGIIKDEYKTHVSKKPGSYFKRSGTMAVEFNGNHYTVLITPGGRLEQFHAW